MKNIKIAELAKEIVKLVNESDNNYDAVESVEDLLNNYTLFKLSTGTNDGLPEIIYLDTETEIEN